MRLTEPKVNTAQVFTNLHTPLVVFARPSYKMYIQEMMHCLLAKMNEMKDDLEEEMKAKMDTNTKTMQERMDDNQAKADADSKAWREEIRAETVAIRARTKAMREERMKANMDACMADIKDNREETMTCQEKTEVRLEEELISVEMKPEVTHEEVPREHATMMLVGGLRKQRKGRKQAAGDVNSRRN
jgi:hypothetical protein